MPVHILSGVDAVCMWLVIGETEVLYQGPAASNKVIIVPFTSA